MAYNTKLKLIDVKMEQPSGNTLTLSGNTIFNVDSKSIPKYSKHPNFTGKTSVYNDNQALVDKEYVDNKVGGEFQELIFDDNITVVLNDPDATFGKYKNGDIILASGQTPSWVILDALIEALDPTVNLVATNTNTNYGEENKVVTLNNLETSYSINTPGASLQSFQLQWRRNATGAAGTNNTWVDLVAPTTTVPESFIHNIDDSANRFRTTAIDYRLIVTDSAGGSVTGSTNVNAFARVSPETFAAATVTITPILVDNLAVGVTETATLRERGNIKTSTSGSLVRTNRPNDRITEYEVQRKINDTGIWEYVTGQTGLSSNTTVTIPAYTDIPNNTNPNSIQYRVFVTYESQGSGFGGGTSTHNATLINFRYSHLFGYGTTTPLAAGDVLGLASTNRILTTIRARTINVNVPAASYLHIAYPTVLGGLTEILEGLPNRITAFQVGAAPTYIPDNQPNVKNEYGLELQYNVYTTNAVEAFGAKQLNLA